MVIKLSLKLRNIGDCLYQLSLAHILKISLLAISSVAIWGYMNQQAFINLWLTPDQQGALYFNDIQYDRAANSFEDSHWKAYSLYAAQDFQQAAQIWGQDIGYESLFAAGNAFAHNADYTQSAVIYNKILLTHPNDIGIQKNLALVLALEKKEVKDGKSGKGSALKMDETKKKTAITDEDKIKYPKKLPSDAMWLEQVKANPVIFLQKKFALEYADTKRKARVKKEVTE